MRDLAEHELSEVLAAGTLEDACDEHGENCPAGEGGTCRHYNRTYSFDFESTAREAARWAFVAGRVYAYESASITFWPFADRVPQWTAPRLTVAQRAEIETAAKATAALFVEEFGTAIDPGVTDWDATAWETDRSDLSFRDELDEVYGEAWSLYQSTLVAETVRLAEVS